LAVSDLDQQIRSAFGPEDHDTSGCACDCVSAIPKDMRAALIAVLDYARLMERQSRQLKPDVDAIRRIIAGKLGITAPERTTS
jgi:hypothetical protein